MSPAHRFLFRLSRNLRAGGTPRRRSGCPSMLKSLSDFPDGFRSGRRSHDFMRKAAMLYCAFLFLVIALISAFLAFGGVMVGAVIIAKIVFYVFLFAFIATLVMGLTL